MSNWEDSKPTLADLKKVMNEVLSKPRPPGPDDIFIVVNPGEMTLLDFFKSKGFNVDESIRCPWPLLNGYPVMVSRYLKPGDCRVFPRPKSELEALRTEYATLHEPKRLDNPMLWVIGEKGKP